MSDLPEPLVPADVDLRHFPYMKLDVVRLRDSTLAQSASGDGFRAAVLLWCAAWHQVPAGSVPNDDRLLAHLAGYGRDLRGWRRVKDDALHGFVECSDGLLYHPVLADKAMESWNRSAAAKQSADQRWKRTQSERRANAMRTHSEGNAIERRGEEIALERIRAPPGSDSLSRSDAGTEPPVGAVPTRLPNMDERRESAGAKAERHKEELRAKYGHTRADEIAAIKAVTDPAAVDDETGAGRTAEGARGEGEDGQASDAEPELELPAGGGGDAEGV